MIKKILDNYFSNLLIRRIEKCTKLWCCSFKAEKSENMVKCYIKNYKYEDKYYKLIYSFSKENAFELLLDDNMDELLKVIQKTLEE